MSEPAICYLDHNATTPVAPEVLAAMLPFLRDQWGNPSSPYALGRAAARALDEARARVAALINANPREIVFTGSGTESINTALHSTLAARPAGRRLVTTAVEHSAVLRFCRARAHGGREAVQLPVDAAGALDLDALDAALGPETAGVSIMLANNETGVLFPVREVAARCRRRGVPCHTDAVQAGGRVPIDVQELDVDYLSLSAHKLYAPKGVGVLYVRQRAPFEPYLLGGGQERGRRGGTENVAGIVGLGRAAELALANLPDMTRVRALRDRLEAGILAAIPGAERNGAAEPRLPNTTNLAFPGVEAEGLLLLLDQAGICASAGSACTSGALDPSHVLTAMGCSPARARSSLRLSLGRSSTDADVTCVIERLPAIVARLRTALVAEPEGSK